MLDTPDANGGLAPLTRALRAGAWLLVGRGGGIGTERGQLWVVTLLFLLSGFIYGFGQYLVTAPPRAFTEAGFHQLALDVALTLAVVVYLAYLSDGCRSLLALLGAVLAAWLWIDVLTVIGWKALIDRGVQNVSVYWAFLAAIYAWMALSLAAGAVGAAGGSRFRLACASIGVVVILGAVKLYLPNHSFWYQDYAADEADAAALKLDVEAIYYRQPELLERKLRDVSAGRPGTLDTYFVGFSPYAEQDVFIREIKYVAETVGATYGSSDRSVVLLNHASTTESHPLANQPNLERTLARVGELMNEEDVLFLYLTSHGSRAASLASDFWPVRPNPIDAKGLRRALDESGIRWRVVVVSACFSGSFIEALKNEHTLILTAARPDRTSFGCSSDRDLTYFAEHFFEQQLAGGASLLEGFDAAVKTLTERESAEGFEPSEPQRFVGEMVRTKLAELEALRSLR